MRIVSPEEARRIAVRAQLLDGSATTVLDTIRALGFLQIDPISTVAPPQQLVLWSRLGPYDVAELDRLLWDERKLFEWNAYIWPAEDLPLLRARMRRRRPGATASERMGNEFLREHASLKRYILRELERDGPLPSRDTPRALGGEARREAPLVGGTERVAHAPDPQHARRRGRRRALGRQPAVGPRRALVPGGGDESRCATPSASSRRSASAHSACD